LGKSEEGIAVDDYPDVSQQSPKLGASSPGCVALRLPVPERARPGAARDGRVVHAR